MNKLIVASAVAAPLVAGAAGFGGYKFAQQQELQAQNDGFAEVITAVPSISNVQVATPRRECRSVPVTYTETVKNDRTDSTTNTVVGGVIGGVIGNQFGSGHGKTAMTVAGTAVGASIGHARAERLNRPKTVTRTRYEERCSTVKDFHTEQKTNGYDVTYRYQGQVFTTHMDSMPPQRFPVSINVTPAPMGQQTG